ncbi:putative conidiation-specific expression protein [Saccharata proteae CBS 121410]|uniref:Conidiation-specific expression protein n=1 Tax=Saccharata proteae CBS 121410 TaxID=1314787 RepID=A0A9P4HZJ4_9PEZI|nr:putative conidiation-specific expression protein [Saccharata proteae CBS 121410]
MSHQNNMAGYSEDMQNINQTTEDISHMATGHKANLSNPNTSEASKERSRQALEELGGEDAFYGKKGDPTEKNPGNVAGGLKATINQPGDKVSDEAREDAQERLKKM